MFNSHACIHNVRCSISTCFGFIMKLIEDFDANGEHTQKHTRIIKNTASCVAL